MGDVTRYPATMLSAWETGFNGHLGGCMDTVSGGMILSGYAGFFRRYSLTGSLIADYQQASNMVLHDVKIDPSGIIYADTGISSGYYINVYSTTGTLTKSYKRPGSPQAVGDIVGKIFIRSNLLYIPQTLITTPYQISINRYVPSTGVLNRQWYVTDAGITDSGVDGLYIDSAVSYMYVSFVDRGIVVKYLMHTAGGLYYLEKVWQFGVMGSAPITGPSGLCVDETNGYVYVVKLSEPYVVYVLDATTGTLLWTWDCFHTRGSSTLTDFAINVQVMLDGNNDLYIVAADSFVIKLKGFYDPLTHETYIIKGKKAVRQWTYRFGPL